MVGEGDAGFEERDLAVELQPCRREVRRGQAELAIALGREQALEGEIVDGEQGFGPRLGMLRQQQRDEAGMPIIGMHQIGLPVG
jgi:hypothetical protein